MADPRSDTAGGLAALPPPPPPQTEASDAGAPQTPRAPLRETPVATDAASQQPPVPPLPPLAPLQEQRQDGKGMNQPQSRWSRVRSPVLWLLSLFRLRLERQSQLIDQPKILPPPPEEDIADKAPAEESKGEGSKRRRDEAPMSASGCIPCLPPESGIAGDSLDSSLSPMMKKFQNAGRLVKKTLSWYSRHRSQEKPADEVAAQAGKAVKTKPSTSPQEEETTKSKEEKVEQTTKKPHQLWAWAEARLENILEDACTRLVAAEFRNLSDKNKQCLLTSFVFDLGAKVKKQAVTYWWATQFCLRPDDANDIFSALSSDGFLEPIKNRCSGVIHGCRVNPLVHWMVKKEARDDNITDRDDYGKTVVEPILCLTTGNRDLLEKIGKGDEFVAEDRFKRSLAKKASMQQPESEGGPYKSPQDVEKTERENQEMFDAGASLSTLETKRIILNISAHVYRLPEVLLTHFADRLEVLQLGGWRNSDDNTYMEVYALESLTAIGKLKKLRYLGLRGLSRLTKLPTEVRRLRQLAILDVRGCQNLVRVSSAAIKTLNRLTHLDLTECYMLEHIGRGVAALSELQVFKGFVFGVGKRRSNECRLQDLAKLRKLRKLSINVTTDAYVAKGEMAQLGWFAALKSLTVTWGELPSVLLNDTKMDKQSQLLERWTDLVLPKTLEKLDVRCYPNGKLPMKWFKGCESLRKLYVRGGKVKKLDIPDENSIEILRLRYLNEFEMPWDDLVLMLNKNTQTIKCVEVVDMDQKVMRNKTKQSKNGPIKKRMGIPRCKLDEVGVWERDVKEEENGGPQALRKPVMEDAPKTEAATSTPVDVPKISGKAGEGDGGGDAGKARTEIREGHAGIPRDGEAEEAEDDPPSKEDGDTGEVQSVDGGDERGRDMVKKEQGNKKKVTEENGVQVKDEKMSASSPAPASGGDVKEGAEKNSELQEAPQAPGIAPTPKTGTANGADVPKAAGKSRKDDDDANHTDRTDSEAEDESDAKEDRGVNAGAVTEDVDAGAVREVGGGDADPVVCAEDEGEDVGGGPGARGKLLDQVDQRPATREDGGGSGDTSTAGSMISAAARQPKVEEASVPLPAAAKAGASPQALPADTDPAPAADGEAAKELKEPGKA